ncbi:hypothetical protein BGW36DRAFT_429212 [Talaromyces proteolyticus]|uniref:Sterigmatocystin biosynthesis monooxygenase stcW n=1 Tax=Talaromyces proteolyticus TaxID=1131652 RepID=A0AAD4KNA1_9EURO|nr:uncharacterized protein BGW36DRAFT_429212 [Talaromyces proteolyticus]KAH8695334.1 hypothetical protein BGW36DRAFT_429212 [Talaromyces proteolyticus]
MTEQNSDVNGGLHLPTENRAAKNSNSTYELLDQIHSSPRRIRIIHVGAGVSGLLTAYKAERLLTNYEFICYEKNPVIGGTWWENRYPGCACDVPSPIYSFSFEPNPKWERFYASSDEIQQYMLDFCAKYDLEKYIRLNKRVVSAVWSEDQGQWTIQIEDDCGISYDHCDVLINGTGVVNKWKWPEVEGLESFKGTLVHSANWDPSTSWKDQRVALIGIGSSAIQLLPELAQGSKSVHIFGRSPTWISPPWGYDAREASSESSDDLPTHEFVFTDSERAKFESDPDAYLLYRKKLETRLDKAFPIFLRDSPHSQYAKQVMRGIMEKRLGPGNEELKKKIIPEFSPGCRRLTPGNGFLETFREDHIHFEYDGVQSLTEKGLVSISGKTFEFDLIVCATGFDVSYIPHFNITGIDGLSMQEAWAEEPNIYLSLTAPKFPNYFVINGPTGNWAQGCVLPSHEIQVEYALKCCKKMQEDRIKALEVRQFPTAQFNAHLDLWHRQYSVWAENCHSWYKNSKEEGRVYLWPGSLLHMLKTLSVPRFEHYDIRYQDDNIWASLGLGRTALEQRDLDGEIVDLAPFIRNSDVPWSID